MPLIAPPRKISATIATMAMRARISAYSARPWPSSSRRIRLMRALKNDMWFGTSFPQNFPTLGEPGANPNGRSRTLSTAVPAVEGFESPQGSPGRAAWRSLGSAVLDRRSYGAEDAADRAAQEEQGHDRNDRDEGEDQRVLRETLAFLVAPQRREERGEEGHGPSSGNDLHAEKVGRVAAHHSLGVVGSCMT